MIYFRIGKSYQAHLGRLPGRWAIGVRGTAWVAEWRQTGLGRQVSELAVMAGAGFHGMRAGGSGR